MEHPLSIDIYCAAGVGDLLASVELEDGTRCERMLPAGRLDTTLAARPRRVTFDTALPQGASSGQVGAERAAPACAQMLDASTLFDDGLDVPESGRVAVQVAWGSDCHGELHVRDEQGRFGSFEHIQCALWVGRDAIADDAAQLPAPAEIAWDTPLQLDRTRATFGEIICLAGDFYAHLDKESADLFATAWPELSGVAGWLAGTDYRAALLVEEDRDALKELLGTIHRDGASSSSTLVEAVKTASDGAFHRHPARRYLALASQNYCHFGSPDPMVIPNEALGLYRGYHNLAIERAREAGASAAKWTRAVVTEAFACHFLTDLFASGHIRTPRRPLGERFGVLRGSLKMSKAMHDEDNEVGLWVTPMLRPSGSRVVWRAYGDGRLLDEQAACHLRQVQEVVRRSVWEIHEANAGREVESSERAESWIPVPLMPGDAPGPTDVFPDGARHEAVSANHPPLYLILPNGHIGERDGGRESTRYRDLEDRAGGLVQAFV